MYNSFKVSKENFMNSFIDIFPHFKHIINNELQMLYESFSEKGNFYKIEIKKLTNTNLHF